MKAPNFKQLDVSICTEIHFLLNLLSYDSGCFQNSPKFWSAKAKIALLKQIISLPARVCLPIRAKSAEKVQIVVINGYQRELRRFGEIVG